MASISVVCNTSTPKAHHHSASIFIFQKPSATLKPIKISFLSTKNRAFTCKRLVASGVTYGGVVIRAGVALDAVAPNFNRPGSVVESDKLPSDVRKRAMDALDACEGGRVTIGDVASKAGLKLDEAQKALQALAADTDGFLEVSDKGDVLYVFPKDYRSKLAAKSFQMKVEPLIEKGKSTAEYVMRVSFGTTLIASIVIVCAAIIVILASGSGSDNDKRGGRSNSYSYGFSSTTGPSPTDLFCGSDNDKRGGRSNSYSYGFSSTTTTTPSPTDLFCPWDPYYDGRRQEGTENNGPNLNFIESVFSFVFGDGDPNKEIEEKGGSWYLLFMMMKIGECITANGGVVTAEELSRFLDVETPDRTLNDESYILPVLLRFDGQPEVDEEGNILYRFPSLQRTAGRKEFVGENWAGGVERFLEEKKLEFSKTSTSQKALVIGLGGLNLSGVIILDSLLKNLNVKPTGFITFVTAIFPLLQIYAGSFFAIPFVRWFCVQKKNASIEKRNQARAEYVRLLEMPDPSLRRKLLNARDMAQRTAIGQDQIVYSTNRDLVEQEYDTQEWDTRLGEIDKSD